MIDSLFVWANNNQGVVAILLFVLATLLAILGYFIKRWFSKRRSEKTLIQKQKGGDNSTNIQAGRDINLPK
jgi:Na+-transporting methylmalonyl-CoA/oxaloacetate decarboxylase gamma subunit